MTGRFPDMDEARNWYVVSLDGLRHMRQVLDGAKPLGICDETLDQIFGMTQKEWNTFIARKEDEHEAFATLALLAACEGGIRRDYQWRGERDRGQAHFSRFQAMAKRPGHTSLSSIFDAWQKALKHHNHFPKHLSTLRGLYTDRNALAHGRATLKQFNFVFIYEQLSKVRQKWRQAESDFQGF